MTVKRSQWIWVTLSVAVLVAAGIGGWKFGQVTPAPVAAPPSSTTTAGSLATSSTASTTTGVTTTTADPTTSVPTTTSTTVLGKIDFTSDLISAFGDNLQRLELNGGMANLPNDKVKLESITGISWSTDMVVALGASYCNDWPTDPATDDNTLSEEGERQWAEAMAPVLGAPVEATFKAIRSGIPFGYQMVCD